MLRYAMIVLLGMAIAVAGPSAPLNLKASEVTESSITLYWEAPKVKGSGLEGYRILRNESVVATVSGLSASYRDTDVEPATSYVYKVIAFDTTKLESPASAAVTAKTRGIKTP